MKKVVLFTLVCISAMLATVCKADSGQKDSNATQPQPKNEIWYTSSDGTIVEPDEKAIRYHLFGENVNIVSNTYQDGKGVIVFSDDVRYIGAWSFKGSNLTSISIPEDVNKIQSYSFSDCTSLSSITIPNSVTDIQKSAFYNCTSLSSITIPNSVTNIGERAFSNCTSLTSIIIPNSVTDIGESAFSGCTGLTSIYCKSSNPPRIDGTNAFGRVSSDCNLYVPTESVEIYKKTDGWKKFYFNTVGYDFPQSSENKQYDSADEYDVMVEEFASKVDRLEDLILDMSDSDNPFAYVKQIETLAAECEKLHKKLKAAPLDSSQRLYVNEIYAELEDLVRRLTWN